MEQITPWVDKLNSMASADEIAAFFEEEGITGNQKAASSCVISNFLYKKAGKRVSTTQSYVSTYEYPAETRETEVELGEVTKTFIANFDEGKYPKLIKHRG